MPVTFMGLIAFVILLRSFTASTKFVIFSFVLFALFQASAAFFLAGTGVTPSHFLILALVVLCVRKGNLSAKLYELLKFPSVGFFPFCFAFYCLATAYFLPRLFYGATEVSPVSSAGVDPYNGLPILFSLAPTMGNVTQPIYIIGSLSVFLLVIIIIESIEEYQMLLYALLSLITANIFFGFLDLITFFTHTEFLFAIIRNGNYAMLVGEYGFLGLKRIAGTFPETSTYSAFTLVFFSFTTRLWLGAFNSKYILALSAIQLVLLMMSTSSTAIVGLAVMPLVLWLTSIARLATRPVSSTVYSYVTYFPLVITAVVLVILLNPSIRDSVVEALNSSLINKGTSASGIERLGLNAQALENFRDTWGVGVGVGSARTSSWILAVTSNVGIPGLLFFGIFMGYVFLSGSPFEQESAETTFQQAARMACLAGLLAGSTSGTSIDLGIVFYIFAAAAYLPHFFFWRRLPQMRAMDAYSIDYTV